MSRPDDARSRRPYRLGVRAERQAATRQRITDATLELHGRIGPARTTIRAVADLAGVERLTVYRHFPDERALFAACSTRFMDQHPPPDLSGPLAIADARLRVEAVLLALYRYYRTTATVMASLLRDEPITPALSTYLAPYHAMLAGLADGLAAHPDVPATHRPQVRAATGHALAFETWRSLTADQGQSDAEAAALMATLVATATARQLTR